MTLWINGDWVTGLGERRVKTNPVGGDVLWHGNDADATQVTRVPGCACSFCRLG
jgi:succinylglutamic semialdehyde dehydrogenase